MFDAERISYKETNSFTPIVNDYLERASALQAFYQHTPDLEGIAKAIEDRKAYPTDRSALVSVIWDQYSTFSFQAEVKNNIELLHSENCFTVCTAHQPNIFTGPLYFIYKILHVIKLAEYLKGQFPANKFVPVYYMGSEDADLDELNHVIIQGKKYQWNTQQKGSVGRMVIDKKISDLLDAMEGQLAVLPFGSEISRLLRSCYREGIQVQQATFEMVNAIFGSYGLVVIIADDARLKTKMVKVFTEDLFDHIPAKLVKDCCARLENNYAVQVNPRDINLFYLKDNIRERIEKKNDHFIVVNTDISFTGEELSSELKLHPERFSPNVVLRCLYQETILPNIAFIGGGGELAYWLQMKNMFENYGVPFPSLILRNSFLIVTKKWKEKILKAGITVKDLFQQDNDLVKMIVEKYSSRTISLNGNFEHAEALFEKIGKQAGEIDPTLEKHVAAIKTQSIKKLQELEKKMFRAEKKKFENEQRQVKSIKTALFPGNGLQERIENFAGFYAGWGKEFIEQLYRHSPALDLEFTVLVEK